MAQRQSDATRHTYLEVHPHPWRRQLALRGRNIRVGQLVASMRANKLTPEEAADDYNLPLEQVEEALAYYAENSDFIDNELREDRRRSEARGYVVEPPPVPR